MWLGKGVRGEIYWREWYSERKKLDKNYEWGQINSGLVGLVDISVSRMDVIIMSGLTSEPPWSM